MGTPDTIHLSEKMWGDLPVIAINEPANRVLVKGFRHPVYFEINCVLES